MAKKATLEKPSTITPDENLDSEVAGLTPNPFENPVTPQVQAPTLEVKVEFKQPAFEVPRLTTIFGNLSMAEISDIHAALVANSDKQAETKIFLFLRSLEEIGIKHGRITVKE